MDLNKQDGSPSEPPMVLHPVFWLGLPSLLLVCLLIWTFTWPEMVEETFRLDKAGGGIVEHGTVVFLAAALIPGLRLLAILRRSPVPRWARAWLVLAVIGTVFFAGEECSWGQHYFGWSTPPWLARRNRQQEFNLHNLSVWFNQHPRLLFELWVMGGGALLPWVRRWQSGRWVLPSRESPTYWFWPPPDCWYVAGLFSVLRVLEWAVTLGADAEHPYLRSWGSAELREYHLAVFLFLYLASFARRLELLRDPHSERVGKRDASVAAG